MALGPGGGDIGEVPRIIHTVHLVLLQISPLTTPPCGWTSPRSKSLASSPWVSSNTAGKETWQRPSSRAPNRDSLCSGSTKSSHKTTPTILAITSCFFVFFATQFPAHSLFVPIVNCEFNHITIFCCRPCSLLFYHIIIALPYHRPNSMFSISLSQFYVLSPLSIRVFGTLKKQNVSFNIFTMSYVCMMIYKNRQL